MSKYVAESMTMIAERFGHEGLCQLRTELKKLQCEIGYIANTGQWCCVMKSACINDQWYYVIVSGCVNDQWCYMIVCVFVIGQPPAIIVIDSATYLLTISSPDINKVAMSLYDIKD